MLRAGYGQLDLFAEWTADEYFALEPEQKDEFRARFQRLHAWHRYDQLPDYARFLASVSARLRAGPDQQDAVWIGRGIEERYRTLVARSAGDAAAMLMTISPEQLEALQRKWDEGNRRFVSQHRVNGTAEEQRRARVEREIERIEDWVGSLSREQENRVAELISSVPLAPRLRYEDRLRRQRGFMRLMEQRANPGEFASRLRHFLLNWEEGRAPEYQRIYADWREKQAGFYLQVVRMLTERQRAELQQRLKRYSDDFTRLAQREGGGTASGSSRQQGCPGCPASR